MVLPPFDGFPSDSIRIKGEYDTEHINGAMVYNIAYPQWR